MSEPLHITLEYLIRPEQVFTYINLPFEVPPHTGRIEVQYQYAGAISSDPTLTDGNTIDIGIIDPRGPQFLTQGFRGWSGSARKQFFVAERDATPGYMPGPIQAGTWHICLGAYKVVPQGCLCTVNITLLPAAADQPVDFPALLPVRSTTPHPARADHWYKGEIHCHTVNSDGDSTVDEVIHIAEQLGLDFLAITDHNNRSQQLHMARHQTTLTLIPGYEVTTYYGHWNIWGDGQWVDFRIQTPHDLQQAIEAANAYGYVVSCNHPRPYGPMWAFPEVEGYRCVEVWNGPWFLLNEVCLAFWDERLQRGQRLAAVGGSDFHFSKQEHEAKLAGPTNVIYCEDVPSAANLLHQLRGGHAYVTEAPTGPHLELRCGEAIMGDQVISTAPVKVDIYVARAIGSTLRMYTAQGQLAQFNIDQEAQNFQVEVDTGNSVYIRAQIVDPHSGYTRAVSNPIYLAVQ